MSAIRSPLPLLVSIMSMSLFAAWLGLFGTGHAAPAVQQAQTPTPTPAATNIAGRLRFEDNDNAQTGSFDLQIDSLSAPPSGSHYELWLRAGDGEPLSLGALPAAAGPITFTGSTDQPLLANYDMALVSVEPDADSDPSISEQIVLSGSLPADLLAPIRRLYFDDGSHGKGSLDGARRQATIAALHNGFLEKALAADDMATAQNHAEHVINIIVGNQSLFYQDWNRDGQKQDPGDGYGTLVYLDDAAKQTGILSDTFAGWPDGAQFLPLVQQMITATQASQDFANNASERAIKITTTDTSQEAQGFADEVTESLAQSQQAIEDVYRAGSEIAEIRLVAAEPGLLQQPTAQQPAQPTQTAALATVTPVATSTAVTTPVATTEVTPTEVITTVNEAEEYYTEENGAAAAGAALTGTITGSGWLNDKDGGIYEYVPGGEFTMGVDAVAAVADQEQPAHTVRVDSFWLQRTEVTNAQYARCVADKACKPPQIEGWDAPELADHPVSYVDWQQANDYARWAGGRLPTEAEWERACRGDDSRLYPWGDQPPTAETANFGNNNDDTLPVGSLPAGASPYGILDLSGNVWEWTSSLEQPYPYAADDGREDPTADGKRTARGGSFYYTQYQARCTARSGFDPTTANPNFGLRVLLQ